MEIRTSDQLILLAYVVQLRFGGQFETGYNSSAKPWVINAAAFFVHNIDPAKTDSI